MKGGTLSRKSPPVAKKAKHESKDEDDGDEEEQTFTACQIFSGAWDGSLPPADDKEGIAAIEARRGQFILNLFERSGSAIADRTCSEWTLELTRSCMHNFKRTQEGVAAVDEQETGATKATSQLNALLRSPLKRKPTKSKRGTRLVCLWKTLQVAIISMAHVQIANACVERVLCETKGSEKLLMGACRHLMLAMSAWPCNASALLCWANLLRMGMVRSSDVKTGHDRLLCDRQRLLYALECYLAAAKCASVTRNLSVELLQGQDLNKDDKYLVETILLESAKVDQEEHDESYGISQSLLTASCMSALLASALGYHNMAREVLQRFASRDAPVTRIHPNVWDVVFKESDIIRRKTDGQNSQTHPCEGAFCPCVFPNTVPEDLYQTLRHAFRPEAPYWQQSGYNRNVYYSFWTDWPLPQPREERDRINTDKDYIVSNAVEHYIVQCLLPRIRTISKDHKLAHLCGFEWWVHTRPHGANLGHQLHFDTDEALLEQDGVVEYPISASVTYLTSEEDMVQHGPTVLFDQNPNSRQNAKTAWIYAPVSKSFLIFPGDLLHGVLPCITHGHNKSTRQDCLDNMVPHRLTLMVNFWAYHIPTRLKKRRLYGPSGPFPPNTRKQSWVEDICSSYPRIVQLPTDISVPPKNNGLAAVSPAWDCIVGNCTGSGQGNASSGKDDGPSSARENDASTIRATIASEWKIPADELHSTLEFPASGSGINQRFFVKNAPDFFRSTLLEK